MIDSLIESTYPSLEVRQLPSVPARVFFCPREKPESLHGIEERYLHLRNHCQHHIYREVCLDEVHLKPDFDRDGLLSELRRCHHYWLDACDCGACREAKEPPHGS